MIAGSAPLDYGFILPLGKTPSPAVGALQDAVKIVARRCLLDLKIPTSDYRID
jgi:hypothetical protein